jgi:hypothetical protein
VNSLRSEERAIQLSTCLYIGYSHAEQQPSISFAVIGGGASHSRASTQSTSADGRRISSDAVASAISCVHHCTVNSIGHDTGR